MFKVIFRMVQPDFKSGWFEEVDSFYIGKLPVKIVAKQANTNFQKY